MLTPTAKVSRDSLHFAGFLVDWIICRISLSVFAIAKSFHHCFYAMLPTSTFPDVLLTLSALRLQVAPEHVDDLFSDSVTAEFLKVESIRNVSI